MLALRDAGGVDRARRTLKRIIEEIGETPVVLPGGEKAQLTLSVGACRGTMKPSREF